MVVAGEISVISDKEERPGHSKVVWRICNLCSKPKDSDCYKSHSFEFAGERWHLRLYANSLCLRVFIYRDASPRKSSVHIELLYKVDGRNWENSGQHSHTFAAAENKNQSFGIYIPKTVADHINQLFLPRESNNLTLLLSFRAEVHDCLSLPTRAADIPCEYKAKITTNTKPVKEALKFVDASTQTKSVNYTDKLSSDLSQLLLNGEDSDLTIRVKGMEFCLHRNIMGVRTPVFSAMLRHNMKEKETGIVCIDDCEPEVFRAFVQYLYCGMVNELTTDTVFELFTLADKYQVDELKSSCLEFIRGSLSVDTFCDVLSVALTYKQRDLLGQVTDFFAEHVKDILKTVKWMNFMRDNHIQANELFLKNVEKMNSK